jgi:hypothetical protein
MLRRRGAHADSEGDLEGLRQRVAELEHELDQARLDPGLWVAHRFVYEYGLTVRAGPFAGLTFVERAVYSPHLADCLTAKLLGCFERELHPAIERAVGSGYSTFVNVGAAEGYYAVGLAMRVPGARVYAFELDEDRRELCREIARANRVEDRVEILGECDADWLAQLDSDCFAVVDCEGCEVGLLGARQAENLNNSELIVELHDFIDPRSTRSIAEAFSRTHDHEYVTAAPRHSGEFPELNEMFGWRNRELAISELRAYPMGWALLTPNRGAQVP